ncbi:protein phosphatase Slingshot homolog 3 isoform X2 [Bos javanicus]|uniref:Dual specificity protein phosphatase 13B n=3 Tax=Bos TaxID=9903 RepID=A0A8B9Y800_BOSMU|nr:PREDICTED: protein phosphatase Slingshot homolog 3 isoform X2 [Bos indicus]XP_061261383.1 protein phosphatase Slingshot homolog 3 isoform X2 [Bos javanicus]
MTLERQRGVTTETEGWVGWPMAEASLPQLRGDAEATPCPSVLELEELLRAGKVSSSHVDEVWPNLYIGDAQGPGALRGRGEPLRHTGPGLPHAAPAALPAPGGDHREGAPMGLPQQRFPSPALPAGPAAAGCRPELRGQSWALLPAMGLCHFALALLVLLEVVAHVDTQKMVRAQCGARPRACNSIHFLLLPALPLSHGLQFSQKQHQVCRDRRLKAGSKKCPSEKTTAWAKYPHRVSDSLSQLTPDTSHPTAVRPDLQHWPESQGMDSLQKQDLRRPKIHGSVRVSPYQPPTLASLQRLLWVRRAAMLNHINEVWPNLFLGDAYAARDKNKLTQLGITHVVNVAAGKFQVDTGAKFYRGMPLEYYGIEADDNPFFDLSVYFLPVARYIRSALSVPQGRVLVHCAMGVSRSATVVLAFLMICENMTLVEAIQTVQAHRDICPNSGFLRQLQVLDNRLGRETGRL